MPLEYLISAAVTLFVVVDPIGLAPTFLSVTTGIPDSARRDVALRAAVIAGAILAGAALIGDWLLRQLRVRFRTSSRVTKLSQHEADGGKFQEAEGVAVEIFPILGETATTIEPCDGSFNDPTLW